MTKNYLKAGACPLFLSLMLMACNSATTTETGKEKNIIVREDSNNKVVDQPTDTASPGNKTHGTSTSAGEPCDQGLWKFVYNPDRLKVIDKCKTVTGVIVERSADEDGDEHMLLKLDPGQENLLMARNTEKKGGNLVIEAVCINNVTRKKVGSTCVGYVNHVQLPNVNDHVRVTGSLVVDSNNGNEWTEIHPITKVEVIK